MNIKNRKLKFTLEFSRPGGGYIYLDTDGHRPGTLGRQICAGGEFSGSTLSATDETEERVCRRWYRQWLTEAKKNDFYGWPENGGTVEDTQ